MEVENLWNGWKIDSLIGEGSFGKVYKIVRQEFGHTYYAALKTIEIPQNSSELDSVLNDGMDEKSVTIYFRSMVEDIVEEFVLMSKLKGNSNIVSYEDHAVIPKKDNFGWKIYIRMELLTPLFKYVKKHVLSTREIIQLGIDICQALEMCAKYNIIHRDIKPENIFISDFGKFKLGDFGIARQMEKTSSLSKKGTYSYMAPEVYKGLKYNATVDIYSLGIVLYRFLNNNRTPFMPPAPQPIRYSDRENANAMRMSGKEIPAPCNADEKLAAIILKACAYHPADRYAHASEMKDALMSVINLYSSSDNGKNGKSSKNGKHAVSGSANAYSDKTVSLFRLSEEEKQKLEKEKEELLRKEVEEKRLKEEAERQRREAEEKRLKEEAERQRREAEEKRLKEEAERQRREAEEKRLKEEAERQRREAEERRRKEEAERQRREAEERRRKEEAERQRREAEERRRKEEAERQRREAEERRRKEEAEKQRREAEERRRKEEGRKDTDTADKKKILIPAAIAVCIGVGGGIGFYQHSLNCTVPSVVNLTVQQAEELLNSENLGLSTLKEEYSDTFEEGLIISQDHEKGETVRKDTEIGVVVSKGIMMKTPELKGMILDEAVGELNALGVNLQVAKEEYSDSIKKGYIISQEPDFDSELFEGDVVKVVVSKGEEQIAMPSVVGKEEKEAGKILKDLQLSYKTKEEYSDDTEKGKIISQDIKSGTNVKKDTVITLTISKGKEEKETTAEATAGSQSSGSSSGGSSNKNSGSSSGGSSSQSSGSSSGGSSNKNSGSSSGGSSNKNSGSSSGGSSNKNSGSSSGGSSNKNSGSSSDEEVINSWDDPDEEVIDSWDDPDEEVIDSWD